MGKIYIIQHCQSEHHINGMSGGWTDTPLTGLGRKQAKLVGLKLRQTIVSGEYRLYSSDLLRAKQTAEIVGAQLGLDIVEEAGLREINTGIAAGKTKDWAKANRNPRIGTGFDLDYQEFDQGETWRQFFHRVCNCMDNIYHEEQKNLIITTHGGTLSYIIAWWLNLKEDRLAAVHFSASAGSVSLLQTNSYQQHALHMLNDTSHLVDLINPNRGAVQKIGQGE